MEENTTLKIQIERVLDVLSSQIYDSPLALLRENVQNAYDAILMRQRKEHANTTFKPQISIMLDERQIVISDNGIGMNSKSLRENFWTAGSSGKNTEEAREAGVVGTFGIGAMANFGVCSELKVVSRAFGEAVTYTSYVQKSELSLEKECIHTSDSQEQLDDYGTTITGVWETGFSLSVADARSYLLPYVQYIPVPVMLNNELLSQKPIALTEIGSSSVRKSGHVRDAAISFDYTLSFNRHSFVSPQILIENISLNGLPLNGIIYLKSSESTLYGLRNYFGLAPIPLASAFNFGGVVNMAALTPTAGREAVSRTSIDMVAAIMKKADEVVARAIAEYDIADQCRELLLYIKSHRLYELADNVRISVGGTDGRMKLGDVAPVVDGKETSYYEGRDPQIINNNSDENHILLVPADDSLRRQIQLAVLKKKGIKHIPDTIDIKPVSNADLSIKELSIATKIRMVLADDYLMNDAEVKFAQISHNLASAVQKEKDHVVVYLSCGSSDIDYLSQVYEDNYSLFEPLVKDYVRTKLYAKLSQYVPSSTRDGAEALYNILLRKRELYTIEYSDLGEMELVMKDYLDGKVAYKEVLKVAKSIKNKQTQQVTPRQIGDMHEVLSGIVPVRDVPRQDSSSEETQVLDALPPVLRTDIDTKYRILHTDDASHSLLGYNTFLALSDRMRNEYYEFFLQPHTTRIIWSMHKIIYIFTHVSSSLTLYYDMELEKKLDRNTTGGRMIQTATIVTKNSIFIPVIHEMDNYFNIKGGQLKFSVRFEALRQ